MGKLINTPSFRPEAIAFSYGPFNQHVEVSVKLMNTNIVFGYDVYFITSRFTVWSHIYKQKNLTLYC